MKVGWGSFMRRRQSNRHSTCEHLIQMPEICIILTQAPLLTLLSHCCKSSTLTFSLSCKKQKVSFCLEILAAKRQLPALHINHELKRLSVASRYFARKPPEEIWSHQMSSFLHLERLSPPANIYQTNYLPCCCFLKIKGSMHIHNKWIVTIFKLLGKTVYEMPDIRGGVRLSSESLGTKSLWFVTL